MKKTIALLLALTCALFGCATFNVGAPSGEFMGSTSEPSPSQPAPHKLGALVPQRAGDFFVSPVAASPFKLGQHVTLTDGTTPAIEGDSSATSLTMGTNKAGAVLNLASGAGSNTVTLDESGAEGDAVVSYGGTAMARIGHYSSGSTYSAIWLNAAAASPTTNNFALFGASGYTTVNGVGGNLYLAVSNLNYGTMTTTSFTMALPVTLGTTTGANTLDGSLAVTERTATASFTVDTTTTDNTIKADTTTAAFTITLVAPPSGSSRIISLINPGTWATHNLTLSGGASYTVNGSSSKVLSGTEQLCHLQSDGSTTAWFTDCL